MFADPGESSTTVCNPSHSNITFTANLFTPWFKLIARDFLFSWWDELLHRKTEDGTVDAKRLVGVIDGSLIVRML